MSRLYNILFRPVDLYCLALLRIILGAGTFLYFIAFAPYVLLFYGESGFLSLETSPLAGFHLLNFSILFLSDSAPWVIFCYTLLLATSLLYTLGIGVRLSGPLLWLLILSFVNRNSLITTGVPLLVIQLLVILMFAHTGQVLTAKRREKIGSEPVLGPDAWALYLVRLELCIVYFQSGMYKLLGEAWLEGTALSIVLANPEWRRFDFSWFLDQGWFYQMLLYTSTLVALWEFFFPLLVVFRKTRYITLGFGVLLHSAHLATIETGTFVPILFGCYLAFLPNDSVRKGMYWLQGRIGTNNPSEIPENERRDEPAD